MNTPTHMLASASVLGEENDLNRNLAAVTGAFVPDLAIYSLWGAARLTGYSEQSIWGRLYELPVWQDAVAMGNSVFLYAGLLLIAFLMSDRFIDKRVSGFLIVLSLSALLHLALDFPVHVKDAHAHFWPLSEWRFHSSVSYWNPAYHGNVVRAFEASGALLMTIVLWRRHASQTVRTLLVLNMSLYALVPAYFMLSIG